MSFVANAGFDVEPLVSLLSIGVLKLWIARLEMFGNNHASPLNLSGWIRMRKWIIPKYDRIFVAPLFIVIVVPLLSFGIHFWLDIPLHTLIPLFVLTEIWRFIMIRPDPLH